MAQREKESAQGDRDRRDRSTTQDKFPEVPVHEHVPENDTRAREEEEAIEPTVNPAVQPTSESLADACESLLGATDCATVMFVAMCFIQAQTCAEASERTPALPFLDST